MTIVYQIASPASLREARILGKRAHGFARYDRMLPMVGIHGNIVILTGAGISAESGMPTFRDKDGLHRCHPHARRALQSVHAMPRPRRLEEGHDRTIPLPRRHDDLWRLRPFTRMICRNCRSENLLRQGEMGELMNLNDRRATQSKEICARGISCDLGALFFSFKK